jgi:hypothetical protein
MAVLSLHDEVVSWPSEDDKKSISRHFLITYGLPNCIGIIDGTIIFLTEPEWSGEDSNTWKGGYAVNALVVCCQNGKCIQEDWWLILPQSRK